MDKHKRYLKRLEEGRDSLKDDQESACKAKIPLL